MKWFLAFMLFSTATFADDNSAKQIAAIPLLVSQRNNALDQLALCGGELELLRTKITELQKQIDDAKPKDETKK